MRLIEKIGLTWVLLIGILLSVCLGAISFVCPFLIVIILLCMMSVGGIGWCVYYIYKVWSDNI